MSPDPPIPVTRVLAVASHVVSGNVGNKIAVFTMQSMGCEVDALNTVQFSNHTGYRQWTGARMTADAISELWAGLKQSYLDDYDMMLSGYIPGAAAVEAVGRIAEELKARAAARPGRFFWVLDPVMGDNGSLYVAEDVVPAYKRLLAHADLILPNQFEAELLSGVKIKDMATLHQAIAVLHAQYGVPHVIITSVSLPDTTPPAAAASPAAPKPTTYLSVVGSTRTSAARPRAFKIVFPAYDCHFNGTGDMFAALMVVRLREAVSSSSTPVGAAPSWVSPDEVPPAELPLARAAELVLASMHEVLGKTCEAMEAELSAARRTGSGSGSGPEAAGETEAEAEKRWHLLRSRAAELRLVRNLDVMRWPKVAFRATEM